MTEAKHTPGPWRIAQSGNFGNCVEGQSGRSVTPLDSGWRTVATFQEACPSDKYTDQEENRLANGRLIAAAPDMFDALRKAKNFILCNGDGPEDQAMLNEVETAIGKATGAQ